MLSILVVVMPFVVFAAVFEETTVLEPGQNTTLLWECGILSDDYNGTFVCRAGTQVNENVTFVNLTLDPGSTLTGTEGHCEYEVACNAHNESSDEEVCSIDKRLKPGQELIVDEGPCEVEIECREQKIDCDDYYDELDTIVRYIIDKNGTDLTITIGEDAYDFDLASDRNKVFYTLGEVPTVCPYMNSTSGTFENLTFAQCLQYKDLFMSPQDYMSSFVRTMEHWTILQNQSSNDIVECRRSRDALKDDRDDIRKEYEMYIEQCTTTEKNLQIDLNNKQLTIDGPDGWKTQLDSMRDSRGNYKVWAIFGSVLNVLQFIVILFIAFVVVRKRRRGADHAA